MAGDAIKALGDASATDPFRLLLDEVGAFIYVTDRDGRFTYVNRRLAALLGVAAPEELLGKAFVEFAKLEGTPEGAALREADLRVLERGETIEQEETNVLRATGEVRTYWTLKRPLRDGGGAIVGMLGISQDITERKQLEAQLRQQNQLLDTVLDNVDAYVYMKGADRRYLYVNRRFADAVGASPEAIRGRLDDEVLPKEQVDPHWERERCVLASGERHVGEMTYVRSNGEVIHTWDVIVRSATPQGAQAVIGLSADITALFRLKELLRAQAMTDELTGLANRRSFWERAESEFARARRHGSSVALLSVDLDHFKDINDRYGHLAGDRVLRAFAANCQARLRTEDLAARMGGEEFCFLLPETNVAGGRSVAERIRESTRGLRFDGALSEVTITASFGVVALDPEDASFEALYARADRALYKAKSEGRDRVVCA